MIVCLNMGVCLMCVRERGIGYVVIVVRFQGHLRGSRPGCGPADDMVTWCQATWWRGDWAQPSVGHSPRGATTKVWCLVWCGETHLRVKRPTVWCGMTHERGTL